VNHNHTNLPWGRASSGQKGHQDPGEDGSHVYLPQSFLRTLLLDPIQLSQQLLFIIIAVIIIIIVIITASSPPLMTNSARCTSVPGGARAR